MKTKVILLFLVCALSLTACKKNSSQTENTTSSKLEETSLETTATSEEQTETSQEKTSGLKKAALLRKAIEAKKQPDLGDGDKNSESAELIIGRTADYSEYDNVDQVIDGLIKEFGFEEFRVGIAYNNLATDESYYLNENMARHAASTNKLGTAVLFVDLIEAGDLTWKSSLPASAANIEEGNGMITNNPPQASYTLEDLMMNLIVYSDNTAWNIMTTYYYNNIGDYREALIQKSGIKNIPPALLENHNYATPKMLENYLKMIAQKPKYKKIVGFMKEAQEGLRFKLYVDQGMATKYGQYDDGYHDTGIYFENGKPIYTLALMTYGLGSIDEFMGQLNLRINEWYHYQKEHQTDSDESSDKSSKMASGTTSTDKNK